MFIFILLGFVFVLDILGIVLFEKGLDIKDVRLALDELKKNPILAPSWVKLSIKNWDLNFKVLFKNQKLIKEKIETF